MDALERIEAYKRDVAASTDDNKDRMLQRANAVINALQEDLRPVWQPQQDTTRTDRARRAEQDAFAERLRVREEAYMLLDLVASEFRSDPHSVQCFDKRIVDRVIYVAALTKAGHG